jgi:hypothetical protein
MRPEKVCHVCAFGLARKSLRERPRRATAVPSHGLQAATTLVWPARTSLVCLAPNPKFPQNPTNVAPGKAATRAEKLTEHRICLTRIDPKILVNRSLDRFRPTSEVHPCTAPPLRPHGGGTPRPTLTGTDRSRTPCQLSIDKPLYHNPRTFREISTLDSANLSFLPLARESLERASFHTQVRRHAAAGVWRGGGA